MSKPHNRRREFLRALAYIAGAASGVIHAQPASVNFRIGYLHPTDARDVAYVTMKGAPRRLIQELSSAAPDSGRGEKTTEERMEKERSYGGSCFCGAVQFTVTGEPAAMGYCHCASCRHWSAGPVNAFTLWKPEAVRVMQGADKIGTYNKSPHSYRKWCKSCGGHLFTEHPGMGLTDVYAAMLPTLSFKPGVHVHYQETVLPIRDGVTKLKDVPKEMGGSGASLPE